MDLTELEHRAATESPDSPWAQLLASDGGRAGLLAEACRKMQKLIKGFWEET